MKDLEKDFLEILNGEKHLGTAKARAPRLSYLVCTSPRTGSWLLTDMLRQTGIAGRPAEHFDPNPEHERYWVERLGIASETDYLPKIMERATTPNGVCGSKLHWYQFERLCERLGCTPDTAPPALAGMFPGLRYIWIRRRDTVAQAVSLYRAQQTGRWHRPTDPELQTVWRPLMSGPPETLAFDRAAIDACLEIVSTSDAGWKGFFARQGSASL